MSYQKQNFTDDITLHGYHLNHIEDALAEVTEKVEQMGDDPGGSGGASLTIGTVTSGAEASASIEDGKLNLTLPQGPTGPEGAQGPQGEPGPGFSDTDKSNILALFEAAAYGNAEMQAKLDALKASWSTSGETVPVQSVSLNKNTLSLTVGSSETLTATVSPSNATDKTVTWTVSPEGYATVSGGKVEAVKEGACTVTAAAGGKSADCAVTVSEETSTPVYALSAPKTFTASAEEYIDTGVKLFESISPKPEWTIILSASAGSSTSAVGGTYCLAHCMTEASPWPGLSVSIWPTGLGMNVYGYQGSITNFAAIKDQQITIAIQLKDNQVRVVWPDDLGTWNTISSYSKAVPQSLILGAYQETDGTKGRFWDGTIYRCEVYNKALSDSKLTALLNQ